jgi:4-diphosphocytidyl-2-C-methyl-D-erythritol kinase
MPSSAVPADPQTGAVTFTAPAKLNLNLRVTGRRADGYHLLDSAVVFTDFGDRLTIHRHRGPAPGTDSLEVTGPFSGAMPADTDDNICLRAVRAFRDAGGVCAALHIHLDKQIPVGAGLGGGSSDAAAILRHLNRTSTVPLSATRLGEVALTLGADVPVCLTGAAHRMTGIGETLAAITPAPTGHVVLARPDVALSTPAVFARLALHDDGPPLDTGWPADAASLIAVGNDLTMAAAELAPSIPDLLAAIAGCNGNLAAQMSGSGSACFGLFPDRACADKAASDLQAAGFWAKATQF